MRKVTSASLVFFLFYGISSSASQTNAPAATAPSVLLPISYIYGHLFVQLDEKTLGPITLLIDSGWERTTISTKFAAKLHARGSLLHRHFHAIGHGSDKNQPPYRTAQVDLRSAGRNLFAAHATLIPLESVSTSLRHRVDGVLGWDFFQHWCVRIDYAKQQMTLTDPAHCPASSAAYGLLPGKWSKHGLLVPAQITFAQGNTRDVLLHVDTGADFSVSLRANLRRDAGLRAPQSRSLAASGNGVHGSYQFDLVPVKQVRIGTGALMFNDGNIAIDRPGAFTPSHWWQVGIAESRLNRDGDLGNAVLENSIVTFDPVRHCLYLEQPRRK